jgi:hypothetical protein
LTARFSTPSPQDKTDENIRKASSWGMGENPDPTLTTAQFSASRSFRNKYGRATRRHFPLDGV